MTAVRTISRRVLLASLAMVVVASCSGASAQEAMSSMAPLPVATAAPTTLPMTTTSPTTVAASTSTTTTTTASTTTTLVPTTTTQPGQVEAMAAPFAAIGSSDGAEAERIQQRLLDLGFWLLAVDGDYGHSTSQAVLAFQKYRGLERTGKVDDATAAALSEAQLRAGAHTTEGSLAEIDKDRQLLFLVRDGATVWTINASSGSGQYYVEENQKTPGVYESGRSVTPSGEYRVYRQRAEGWWEGDLGRIYRPKYFHGGIAIHGSGNIPAYPASHGCVRVSTAAMDMIWDSELVPQGTTVVVYGADVEAKGPRPTVPPATAAPTTTTTLVDTSVPEETSTTVELGPPPTVLTTTSVTSPPTTTAAPTTAAPTTTAAATTTAAPTTVAPPTSADSTTTTAAPATTAAVPGAGG
ncbi:MAG: L,D-transpeptidase family protein [Ilumatobacteraceae bacterium]